MVLTIDLLTKTQKIEQFSKWCTFFRTRKFRGMVFLFAVCYSVYARQIERLMHVCLVDSGLVSKNGRR
jgi:hypothetical protein